MPNPFYQIYEGAALLAGAKPYFINCTAENDYLGDFDAVPAEVWEKTALLFVCTPGNPTGAVLSKEKFKKLIELSDQYNFVIASDECYSELWFDQPPVGLLEVCAEIGRDDYKNCIVFHSLSKRSNLPGMRSGFVAVMQHCSSLIYSSVPIMVRQCRFNINWLLFTHGTMKYMLKKTASNIARNSTCFSQN